MEEKAFCNLTEQMFLYYLINVWKTKQTKLIKENSFSPYRASPLPRVPMEKFHLA